MYTVQIVGEDGVFNAKLLSDDGLTVDSEDGFGSLKAADKWASERAKSHAAANAAETVVHTRSFSV